MKEQAQKATDKKEAEEVWNWEKATDEHKYQHPRFGANPFARQPKLVITPFKDHPEFQIVYFRGVHVLWFQPCNIAVKVNFDTATNKATNYYHAPQDYVHYKEHYLQYIPLWVDAVVGESIWPNNTHVELINRYKNDCQRRFNNGRPQTCHVYIDDTVGHNIFKQKWWLQELRHKHADTVVKLNCFEDIWKRKSDKDKKKPAHTAESKQLCAAYKEYVELRGTKSLSVQQMRDLLNKDLKKWKRTLRHTQVRKSKKQFSVAVVRSLAAGYELPQIGQPKTVMFQFFFMSQLHNQNNAEEACNDKL